MIHITVGGEHREIGAGISVKQLLALENVEMLDYVSVSVNEEFVLRENFETQVIKDGDNVEFLYFMGGGR